MPIAATLAVAASCLLSVGAVRAQQAADSALTTWDKTYDIDDYYGRGKNTSVLERPRPDYDAAGIQTGGFVVYPRIAVSTIYDSNVFAVDKGAAATAPVQDRVVSDGYLSIDPSIVAQSNWNRHGLQLTAALHNEDFFQQTTENELGYTLRADGRIDVHGESGINLGVDAQQGYEDRGNVYYVANTVKPIEFTTQGVYAKGVYLQDRFRFTMRTDYRRWDYYNATAVGTPTTTIDESVRDSQTWDVGGRTDYAFTPDKAAFVSIAYGHTTYGSGDADERRNSDSVTALTGVNFDINSVARGEIGIGYFDREYSSSQYEELKGLAAAVKVEYFPTQLVTLTLQAQRQPQDAAFNNAGGFIQSSVGGSVDYEVKRNWIVSAAAGYETDDFVGAPRNDQVTNITASSRYFLSRHVGIGANVGYIDRSSSGATPGPAYKVTKVGLSLVFQL